MFKVSTSSILGLLFVYFISRLQLKCQSFVSFLSISFLSDQAVSGKGQMMVKWCSGQHQHHLIMDCYLTRWAPRLCPEKWRAPVPCLQKSFRAKVYKKSFWKIFEGKGFRKMGKMVWFYILNEKFTAEWLQQGSVPRTRQHRWSSWRSGRNRCI